MSQRTVTLLHGSDFHLDQTLFGVANLAPPLMDLFARAPLESARRLVDQAIAHRVDGVLLAGDILHLRRAAPAEFQWLADQLDRLHSERIAVFWVDGLAERRGSWPAEIPLPPGVQRFQGPAPEARPLNRDGSPVATIVGGPLPAEAPVDGAAWDQGEADLPRIALGYARRPPAGLASLPADYVALGGCHRRRRALAMPLALYSGAPQGFSPAQEGPHGCWLIRIDTQHRVARRFLPTDEVRWTTVEQDASGLSSLDDVVQRLLESCRSLASPDSPALLVRWRLKHASRALHAEDARREILKRLAHELSQSPAASRVFSVAVESADDPYRPEQLHESSLLGDFLQAVAKRQGESSIEMPAELADHPEAEWLTRLIRIESPAYRRRLWEEVIRLGSELLQPEPTARS